MTLILLRNCNKTSAFIFAVTGNAFARDSAGHDHGVNQVGSTLHWGPDAGQNKFYLTHGDRLVMSKFCDFCKQLIIF